MEISNEDIAKYFDTHQSSYSRFWSSTALHYGFWYDDTKSLAEAILNTNKFAIDTLSIGSHDIVLDAGCGVGGTSLYIAETTGARVEGITLSDVQLKIARKRAAQSVASSLLNISKQDYVRTSFEDETFSKIIGIESICYAHSKGDFLSEAYRIMKPGGRIAVIDAFLTKEHLNPEEQDIYAKFTGGWVIPNLPTQSQFSSLLSQAGFKNVSFIDMQRYVRRSIKIIYLHSLLTCSINFIKSRLGFARENFSARYQRALFDRRIAVYGVFIADKVE